ncbi:MAG: hypothetical protein ACYCTK_07505 [Acidithiobacillus ferrooxidans]
MHEADLLADRDDPDVRAHVSVISRVPNIAAHAQCYAVGSAITAGGGCRGVDGGHAQGARSVSVLPGLTQGLVVVALHLTQSDGVVARRLGILSQCCAIDARGFGTVPLGGAGVPRGLSAGAYGCG